jgi:uncharacterized protein DUF1236
VARKQLLSGATICLMLTSGLAYAQSPGETRRDEPKRERLERSEPAKASDSRSETRSRERTREGNEANSQQKNPSARQTGEERRPSSAQRTGSARQDEQDRARGEGAKQNERSDDTRRGNRDNASKASRQEGGKASSTSQREKSERENQAEKSTKQKQPEKAAGEKSAETPNRGPDKSSERSNEKSRTGAPPNESSQTGSGEASKTSPTQSQESRTQTRQQSTTQSRQQPPTENNKPAAENENNSRTSNETRGGVNGSQTTTSTARSDNQARLPRDKEVRISETMRTRELAPPERNLNISISAGTEIPDRVRVHRLPPEIVSIEPEYRDYDYFTTDDEIVIVEPRSHRIVSAIPKDVSRARAEVRGGQSSELRSGQTTAEATDGKSTAGNTTAPCQIMRRDSSGQLSEVSSTTVGSSGEGHSSLTVTVQTPDQGTTQPIALDASAGQIIVSTQGQGDCQVTIEPQTNR